MATTFGDVTGSSSANTHKIYLILSKRSKAFHWRKNLFKVLQNEKKLDGGVPIPSHPPCATVGVRPRVEPGKITIYSTLSGFSSPQDNKVRSETFVTSPNHRKNAWPYSRKRCYTGARWASYVAGLLLLMSIIIPTDDVLYSLLADCFIAYINTKLCDCMSMTYKRQITCRQPEIYGGKDCPEECDSGHVIAGSISCSWDDLDAMKCNAERVKPLSIMKAIILIYTRCLLEGRLT